MTGGTAVDPNGWPIKTARSVVESWNQVGAIKFNVRSVRETGIALTRYHTGSCASSPR